MVTPFLVTGKKLSFLVIDCMKRRIVIIGWICGFNRGGQRDDLELPLFDFETISSATNSFSGSNKLGEGGFGPVYKARISSLRCDFSQNPNKRKKIV